MGNPTVLAKILKIPHVTVGYCGQTKSKIPQYFKKCPKSHSKNTPHMWPQYPTSHSIGMVYHGSYFFFKKNMLPFKKKYSTMVDTFFRIFHPDFCQLRYDYSTNDKDPTIKKPRIELLAVKNARTNLYNSVHFYRFGILPVQMNIYHVHFF